MTPESNEEIFQKQHIIVLSGLPASGKTTLAMQWLAEDPIKRERINYDELRVRLYGAEWKWNRQDEDKMQQIAFSMAANAIGAGKSVCIDNTNLSYKAQAQWVTLAKAAAVPITLHKMTTSIETCINRDYQREGKKRVGRAVIERMALFNGLIEWENKGLYPRDFVVVDMDGTLADQQWRRSYIDGAEKDWTSYFSKCGDDLPIQPIRELVDLLAFHYDILVVTGRPIDLAGKATEDWLRHYAVPCRHLFMCSGGERDSEGKQVIIDRLPRPRLIYSLDDRNRSVEMWRRNGVTTLQVAPGDF